jgi:hypothetical protein
MIQCRVPVPVMVVFIFVSWEPRRGGNLKERWRTVPGWIGYGQQAIGTPPGARPTRWVRAPGHRYAAAARSD